MLFGFIRTPFLCYRLVGHMRALPQQFARGLTQLPATETAAEELSLARRLESTKHYRWHGNSAMALARWMR